MQNQTTYILHSIMYVYGMEFRPQMDWISDTPPPPLGFPFGHQYFKFYC